MIGVLCGLSAEAALLAGAEDLKVYCGVPGARQLALDLASPGLKGLVSFGTAGALWSQLNVGDIVLGTLLVGDQSVHSADAAWLAQLPSGPHVKRGAMLSLGAVSADTPQQRTALFAKYGALAIDEESLSVAQLAEKHRLPFVILRSISDTALQALPQAALVGMNADGSTNIWKVLWSVLADPNQDPELVLIAKQFGTALRSLRDYFVSASAALAAG